MRDGSRIAGNLFWLGTSAILTKGLEFAAVVLMARRLTSEGFGSIAFVSVLFVYLLLGMDLGLSPLATREMAKSPERAGELAGSLVLVRMLASGLIFAAVLAVIHTAEMPATLRLLAVGFSLRLFFQAANLEWIFSALERMRYLAVSRILNEAIFLALLFVWITAPESYPQVPYWRLVGEGAAVFYVLLAFHRLVGVRRIAALPKEWGSLVRRALPFGVSNLLVQGNLYFGLVLVGFFRSAQEVGHYNAVHRLAYLVAGASLLMTTAHFPTLSRLEVESPQRYETYYRVFQKLTYLLVFPVFLGLLFLSRPMVRFFYGGEYVVAAPALQVLALAILFYFLNNLYGTALLTTRYQREVMWARAIGTTAGMGLSLALVPALSFHGAAAGILLSEILTLVILLRSLRRLLPALYRLPPPQIASLAAAAGGLALLLTVLAPHSVPLGTSVAGGAGLYFALLWGFRGLTREDLRRLRDLARLARISHQRS